MNLIEEIKSRIRIEDILDEKGIALKKGRSKCPFHDGTNPTSFRIKNGSFNCFSCGVNGDAIAATQLLNDLDFKQAVEYLAKKAGIPFNREDTNRVSMEKATYKLSSFSVRYYEERLWDAKKDAVKFLQDLYSNILRQLAIDVKAGKISFCDFYTKYAHTEEILAEIDELSIGISYERNNMCKRRSY